MYFVNLDQVEKWDRWYYICVKRSRMRKKNYKNTKKKRP